MNTIAINDQLKQRLDRLARRQKRTTDDVLEELVRTALPAQERLARKGHRLDRLVNLGFHGPKDLGQNVDHYLYDRP